MMSFSNNIQRNSKKYPITSNSTPKLHISSTIIVPSSQQNRIMKRGIVQRAKIKSSNKEEVFYQGIASILTSNDRSV